MKTQDFARGSRLSQSSKNYIFDRRSQMRVANILTCLGWEKLGQKQHQGKRQVVWQRATLPPGLEEVLQVEPQLQQGLSRPTIPNTPNSNKISDSVKTEVKQQQNKKLEIKSDTSVRATYYGLGAFSSRASAIYLMALFWTLGLSGFFFTRMVVFLLPPSQD